MFLFIAFFLIIIAVIVDFKVFKKKNTSEILVLGLLAFSVIAIYEMNH